MTGTQRPPSKLPAKLLPAERCPLYDSRGQLGAASQQSDVRIARVAIVAAPIGRHFLAEVLEDVTRAALRRLAELNHRAELLLIHRAPLLVVLQIRAQVHRAQIVAEPLPLSAAVLAHQSVTLEQRENDLCLS